MKPKTVSCRPAEAALVAVVMLLLLGPWPALASGAAEPVQPRPAVDASLPTEATSDDADDLDWELQSVRELLRRDIQQALRPQTSRGGPLPSHTLPQGAAPGARPRLVAMYGVGHRLMAEVQVGTRGYLYVRGQALPIGHAGDASVYRLRSMNGACVRLERGEDRHSLCLRAMLSEARQ